MYCALGVEKTVLPKKPEPWFLGFAFFLGKDLNVNNKHSPCARRYCGLKTLYGRYHLNHTSACDRWVLLAFSMKFRCIGVKWLVWWYKGIYLKSEYMNQVFLIRKWQGLSFWLWSKVQISIQPFSHSSCGFLQIDYIYQIVRITCCYCFESPQTVITMGTFPRGFWKSKTCKNRVSNRVSSYLVLPVLQSQLYLSDGFLT